MKTTVPCLLLLAGIAAAGSIDDAKSIKEGKAEFAKHLQDLNQKCGSKITATFDEKTTLPALPEKTYKVGDPWYTCGFYDRTPANVDTETAEWLRANL